MTTWRRDNEFAKKMLKAATDTERDIFFECIRDYYEKKLNNPRGRYGVDYHIKYLLS